MYDQSQCVKTRSSVCTSLSVGKPVAVSAAVAVYGQSQVVVCEAVAVYDQSQVALCKAVSVRTSLST